MYLYVAGLPLSAPSKQGMYFYHCLSGGLLALSSDDVDWL